MTLRRPEAESANILGQCCLEVRFRKHSQFVAQALGCGCARSSFTRIAPTAKGLPV